MTFSQTSIKALGMSESDVFRREDQKLNYESTMRTSISAQNIVAFAGDVIVVRTNLWLSDNWHSLHIGPGHLGYAPPRARPLSAAFPRLSTTHISRPTFSRLASCSVARIPNSWPTVSTQCCYTSAMLLVHKGCPRILLSYESHAEFDQAMHQLSRDWMMGRQRAVTRRCAGRSKRSIV